MISDIGNVFLKNIANVADGATIVGLSALLLFVGAFLVLFDKQEADKNRF